MTPEEQFNDLLYHMQIVIPIDKKHGIDKQKQYELVKNSLLFFTNFIIGQYASCGTDFCLQQYDYWFEVLHIIQNYKI
jgi:hypothetical protein